MKTLHLLWLPSACCLQPEGLIQLPNQRRGTASAAARAAAASAAESAAGELEAEEAK